MNKKRILTLSSFVAAIALTALISTNAIASNDSGKRPGPPPEAFAACKGKAAGDSVTFSGRNGEQVEAVCKEIKGELVAAPDKMPPPQD